MLKLQLKVNLQWFSKALITIKSKLTIVKTTMIKMHDGKGEFLAWL